MMKIRTIIFVACLLSMTLSQLSFARNNALDFNSANRQLAQIPDSRSLDINGQAITVEAWIKLPNPERNEDMLILNKENAYEFKVRQNQLQYALYTNNGWAWEGSGQIRANEWTHVAFTYDGQSVKQYVNGQQTSSTNRQGNIHTSDSSLFLSTRPLSGFIYHFHGQIDEVRIWNTTRTQQQLATYKNILLSGREEGLVGYWRLDEGQGQVIRDLSPNGNHGVRGFTDQEEQRDGQWVDSNTPLSGGLAEVSTEVVDFGPIPRGETRQQELLIRNTEDPEDDNQFFEFDIQFAGDQPGWLTIEPLQGRIDPGDESLIIVTADARNLAAQAYQHIVTLNTTAVNLNSLDIPIRMTAVNGVGQLFGTVISNDTGDPVEGVLVEVVADFEMHQTTDDEGNYLFEDIPAFTYTLRASHEDFLPMVTQNVQIFDNDEVRVDFELLFSEFRADPEEVDIRVAPDDLLDYPLQINNDGDGPLTWSVNLQFADNNNVEPWTLRDEQALEEDLSDTRLSGVAFVDGFYYVTGGNNNGEDRNTVYVLNLDFEPVRTFPQFFQSRFGIKNLCWDGQLLWGTDDDTLYGFTTEGELVTKIEAPIRPVRSVVYDPEHDWFWISELSSHIYAINHNGEQMARINNPVGQRKEGMAWFPEDPDGFNLYILHYQANSAMHINKMNVNTGEMRLVKDLTDIEDADGGGLFITRDWDPYSWVAINLMSGTGTVNVWQLANRTDWISLDQIQGVIPAQNYSEINLHFDTKGFTEDAELAADLVFDHDGRGPNLVPVNLHLTGDGGLAIRVLRFNVGWNLVSTNLQPELEQFADVVAPLVNQGRLLAAKNGAGDFYKPGVINNIESWIGSEGYWIKVEEISSLTITGGTLPQDTPLNLSSGWNIAAYLPRDPVDATVALAGLGDNLIIAKDGYGRFIIPEWNFSNLTMKEGNGYLIKLSEDQELVYQMDDMVDGYYSRVDEAWIDAAAVSSDNSFSLLLHDCLEPGMHIEAVTSNGNIVGRGIVDDNRNTGLSLCGDEPSTDETEGLQSGEIPHLVIVNSDNSREPISADLITWLDGDKGFSTNGWGVATLKSSADVPVEFGLSSAYPNPFNSVLRINFAVDIHSELSLAIYDVNGRLVAELINGKLEAGRYARSWNAINRPSGVYFARLSSSGKSDVMKVLLVK